MKNGKFKNPPHRYSLWFDPSRSVLVSRNSGNYELETLMMEEHFLSDYDRK